MAYIEREVERSIVELQNGDLLRRSEIRQIIRERTYFADRKFKFTKHDYLRYIQFENKLFRLVLLRAQGDVNLNDLQLKAIRYTFINRINSIYNFALDHFANDKQLWLLSFDFAKRYSERISRAKFLKALLLHPNWIEAWIEAATYEAEWNKNPTNARLLYQRAISINTKSPSLYLHFFKMEVGVVAQHLIYDFNEVDKLGETGASGKDFNWKKELKAFNEQHNVKSKDDAEDLPTEVKDEWLNVIYAQMEVPKMIFRFAMRNLEGKVKYAMIKHFLLLIPDAKQLEQEGLSGGVATMELTKEEMFSKYRAIAGRFETLREYMFEYLERHFHFDAVIIQLLARKNLAIYSKNNTVIKRSVEISGCQVFQRAILLLSKSSESSKSSKSGNASNAATVELTEEKRKEYKLGILKSFSQYIQSRMSHYVSLKRQIINKRNEEMEMEEEEGDGELTKSELYILKLYEEIMNYLVLRMLETFKETSKLSATTEGVYRDWVLTLTQIDALDDALNVIKMATKQYPKSAMLWKLYSDLHCRQICTAQNEEDRNYHYKRCIAACLKGIQCVELKDASMLWMNMMDVMIAQLTFFSVSDDAKDNGLNGKREDSDSDSDSDSDHNMELNGKSVMERKQSEAIHRGFRKGIQQCLSQNDALKESYLRWTVLYHGEDEEKQMEVMQWFEKQTMKCSPKIYKIILDVYESILLFGIDDIATRNRMQKRNLSRMEKVYDQCLSEHGKTEPQIWVWYVEWSRRYKKLSDASAAYQRAMKTLRSDGLQVFLQRVDEHKY